MQVAESNTIDYWVNAQFLHELTNCLYSSAIELNYDSISHQRLSISEIHELREMYPGKKDLVYYLSFYSYSDKKETIYPFFVPIKVDVDFNIFLPEDMTGSILISPLVNNISEDFYSRLQQELLLNTSILDVHSIQELKAELLSCIKAALFGKTPFANIVNLFVFDADIANNLTAKIKSFELRHQPFKPDLQTSLVRGASASHLAHTSTYSLSGNQRQLLSNLIKMPEDKFILSELVHGAGGNTVVKDFVSNLWVNAAISNDDPPKILFFENDSFVPMGIFDVDNSGGWLEKDSQLLLQYDCIQGSFTEECRREFLSKCSIEFQRPVHNLAEAQHLLMAQLQKQVRLLKETLTYYYACNQLQKRFLSKYGTLESMSLQKQNLMDKESKLRIKIESLKSVRSFWYRQLEFMPGYVKRMQGLKFVSQQFINKFHSYLVECISATELEEMYINDVKDKLEVIANNLQDDYKETSKQLQQLENDELQLAQANKNKFFHISKEKLNISSEDDINLWLDSNLRIEIHNTAVRFWESKFLNNCNLPKESDKADLLILDNAQLCSSVLAIPFIENSKRVFVIKRPHNNLSSWIYEENDRVLVEKFSLANEDLTYEDLQFDGVAASSGNIYSYLINAFEAEMPKAYVLNTSLSVKQDLLYAAYSLSPWLFNDKQPKSKDNSTGNIQIVPVAGEPELFGYSFINQKEAREIISWLKLNHSRLMNEDSNRTISVLVASIAQQELLRELIAKSGFSEVEVYLCPPKSSFTCFEPNNIALCSLVFDPKSSYYRPFEHNDFWHFVFSSVTERLVIFANPNMFSSGMHSATGKIYEFAEVCEYMRPQLVQ